MKEQVKVYDKVYCAKKGKQEVKINVSTLCRLMQAQGNIHTVSSPFCQQNKKGRVMY